MARILSNGCTFVVVTRGKLIGIRQSSDRQLFTTCTTNEL